MEYRIGIFLGIIITLGVILLIKLIDRKQEFILRCFKFKKVYRSIEGTFLSRCPKCKNLLIKDEDGKYCKKCGSMWFKLSNYLTGRT